ncbi:odorant receptor 67d-like [Anopheles maculipalpis]|uniref:odorant receptor 67d-like n=1 Tax=Anopheles maculipalpis TaxID=1496333 RepID=UPI0021598213|nr:odorant receptor 67d-like [Anopheles maculipalpis]
MEYLRGLKKYRFFHYSATDPLEASMDITGGIESFNKSMGVSFFKRKHSFVNFFFIFGISNLVLYVVSVLKSAYESRHDTTKLIYCIATFGFGCQTIMKIYSFIITRQRVVDLYESNHRYYQEMTSQSNAVKRVSCDNASLIYIIIKGTVLVYLLLVIATMAIPGVSSIFLADRILPFGFVMPFIEGDTLTCYVWNYFFQVVMATFYWIITVGTDVTTIYNLITAYGQLDVLMTIIGELDELLERDECPQKIRDKIIEIVRQHQHHRSYLQQLVDFLNPYHFVTLGSTVPTMVISVLGLVLLDWYPGAAIVFLGSVQIFYICFLGTSLEIKTDALTLKVGAIHWNKLSIRDMKYMNFVLAMTQKPKMLAVTTLPLNITAFLKIHKLIYSLIMMLENTKD